MQDVLTAAEETDLLTLAKRGDDAAFNRLIEPLQAPLFSFIYRMVTHRENAEDALQETLIRIYKGVRAFEGRSRIKTWAFGIATNICLDHLRQKKRWRADAQLRGEQETDSDESTLDELTALMSQPDFMFEMREHIAFCFSCIGRTLSPEEQAALILREIFAFTAQEAAEMMGCSEPVFRHRLAAARKVMMETYENLCQLINKNGTCYQCESLREFAPPDRRGGPLVKITVGRNRTITPDTLFEERLRIVRESDVANGATRSLHDAFYQAIGAREEREN